MASFDIVSEIDKQNLDNAVNNIEKVLNNRYDFQGTNSTINLDKTNNKITIVTDSDLHVRQIEDEMISKFLKQGINPQSIDTSAEHYAAGNMLRKEYLIKEGISKEDGKKINKHIKTLKVKVQSQIQDDQIRVTGKKIDDLQFIMKELKSNNPIELPLQFKNMKS